VSVAEGQSSAKRAQVRFDKFRIFEVSRACGLTGPEQHMLFVLALDADWRNAEWSGTQGELSQRMGIGRHQVSKLVDRLVRRGLVDYVEQFARGGSAQLFIACYDLLVVESASRSKQVTRRRTLDPDWTSFGLGLDSGRPEEAKATTVDLPDREALRNKAPKEEGTCVVHGLECCFLCPEEQLEEILGARRVENSEVAP
jgi:hypothetical protein